MVKCPCCGYEADIFGFKLLREPWRFGFYEVKMFEYPRCHSRMSEFMIKIRPRR